MREFSLSGECWLKFTRKVLKNKEQGYKAPSQQDTRLQRAIATARTLRIMVFVTLLTDTSPAELSRLQILDENSNSLIHLEDKSKISNLDSKID
ncbi:MULTISPECIES: hypothetical protein [unclassified Microcoleus]|uniref:hypothetical protein n=1 Tax=unclassified Microcoleus TaxID=2642155 RepID=UPI002FCFA1F1